uniref:Tc1-like transposase DDE domain-containing protein n=1 Tax=Paramormyrops kingsleyae TaxID=1676925 RepID=A0A3B3SD94_9TELE
MRLVFQQSNTCPHMAHVSLDYLRHVEVLTWSNRSPDLSPIEHVWDQLRHQIRPSANLQVLKGQLQHLWVNLSQERTQ